MRLERNERINSPYLKHHNPQSAILPLISSCGYLLAVRNPRRDPKNRNGLIPPGFIRAALHRMPLHPSQPPRRPAHSAMPETRTFRLYLDFLNGLAAARVLKEFSRLQDEGSPLTRFFASCDYDTEASTLVLEPRSEASRDEVLEDAKALMAHLEKNALNQGLEGWEIR